MSFNYEFGTQSEPPSTQFDPELLVRRAFDLNFGIFEDDNSALSSLESSQLEVPTQYQETNNQSVVALAEPCPIIDMPFDYSWINWVAGASALRGFKILQRHKRTSAWWWRFGVLNQKKRLRRELPMPSLCQITGF
jgi:hypothetical protein